MKTLPDMLNTLLPERVRMLQCSQPEPVGGFFASVHRFMGRTRAQFFEEDWALMPYPFIEIGKLPGERRGQYWPVNGMFLPCVITLDVRKIKTGEEFAEVLAHEATHLWEHHLGYQMVGNKHEEHFHNKMADMGIASNNDGEGHCQHRGYIGEVWADWLGANADLKLGAFVLL